MIYNLNPVSLLCDTAFFSEHHQIHKLSMASPFTIYWKNKIYCEIIEISPILKRYLSTRERYIFMLERYRDISLTKRDISLNKRYIFLN
jgi:hypothetical protein